ncbi:terminase large subunit domain-containing protein [Desulfolutivibrio sp.]|uniref:terminase large subunit domain-containing protein n=1 Tax=Desulfolutivibrio sp. TaxID=2773296 RepID=UPI002F9657AB
MPRRKSDGPACDLPEAEAARAVEAEVDYRPQPKQALLHRVRANEILFGGAAGPGKSHALRFEGLAWCLRISGLQTYLFRRTTPELEKNHILPSMAQFPGTLGRYVSARRAWEFRNGSRLFFCSCQSDRDVFRYQGTEIHLLLVDELTALTEFQYDYLRGRVRCSLPVPENYRCRIPGVVCASNPGGVGHGFVKSRWVDFSPPCVPRRAPKNQGGMMRCHIPARLSDNAILARRDPDYVHRLDALPEPLRSAYKDGRWDVFFGQAFAFSRALHVVAPRPVPDEAPLYMSFDWGYGAPFSVGWWWVDADGRLYRFAEWYGFTGTPGQGLRMTDPLIAQGIRDREHRMGVAARTILRLAGPDCFAKKPDYRGGGQGPSTAEEFARHGVFLAPGDPSRRLKIRQFHERLRPCGDMPPMLQVYDTCEQFLRTIPLLTADRHNVEDIDTTGEDHIYDEACHVCMARPLALCAARPATESGRIIETLLAPVDEGREDTPHQDTEEP